MVNNKDYCNCGEILQLYEKEECDNCYQKQKRREHDEDLKDLASLINGTDKRREDDRS